MHVPARELGVAEDHLVATCAMFGAAVDDGPFEPTDKDDDGLPAPGPHTAGELDGGLLCFSSPGGPGLTAWSVFGRRLGRLRRTVRQAETRTAPPSPSDRPPRESSR
jgi:hypothetical protein